MTDLIEFLNRFECHHAPATVRHQARRCLMDTLGVAVGGATTPLSAIIRDFCAEFYSGHQPMIADTRTVNAMGQALALATTIDALDGHDGFNPAKGHVGAGLIPGLLALAMQFDVSPEDFETALIGGYEAGCRLSMALHGSTPDYHTSGAWVAVAIAAAGGKMVGLDPEKLAHAMGIAEYHGPRSQMMRCIDHPTMLKDGSGWGALAGVSAVLLAMKGFTGAPALTITEKAGQWQDLGTRWLILEQYFKPYPVCRWAQAPVEAVLALRAKHNLAPQDVASIKITSFHEATRLATNDPTDTEQAQYSTAFPAAIAMVRGTILPTDLDEAALYDPEIQRIAKSLTMCEADIANENFPAKRLAMAEITTQGGKVFASDWMTPRWDATDPPSDDALSEKFRDLCAPALGDTAAEIFRESLLGTTLPPAADILENLSLSHRND